MFVTVSQLKLRVIFAGKAGAYPSGTPYGTPLKALPENIRLGWKWLTEANTLDYYNTELITVVKVIMAQAPKEQNFSFILAKKLKFWNF